MVVSFRKKAEFASYQLKEVSQVWFTLCKDNRLVEAGPMEWEVFQKAFLAK